MRLPLAVLLFLSTSTCVRSPGTQDVQFPRRIKACMESPTLRSYRIDSRVNPFYLRGDFDGDGKPDLVVMVRGPKSESTGLAICQGDEKKFVLGAGSVPKFSTEKDDNFLSSDWEVLTLAEFRELVYDEKAGKSAKGEVILLWWEDGSSYVYWDGERYRWFSEPAGGSYK